MIYDLLIVFYSHSLIAIPLEMVALTTSWIYVMIYSIDITHNDKICDSIGQHKFLCKLFGCEAQEGGEVNYTLPCLRCRISSDENNIHKEEELCKLTIIREDQTVFRLLYHWKAHASVYIHGVKS